jgi:Mor family transcriptional regulator
MKIEHILRDAMIYEAWRDGQTMTAIGKTYGIHRSQVSRVLARERHGEQRREEAREAR